MSKWKVETLKLIEQRKKHKKIIVGLDFDDTIFPYSSDDPDLMDRCEKVRELVIRLQPFAKICLWTVADSWSIKYKKEIVKLYGIKLSAVNSSVIEHEGIRKPFFNILLDDNAGLNDTIETIEEFLEYCEEFN